ncbi:hypothetical protein SpCBS45565_g01042 [Spizellomyces sp. 'palustris']|nr:hypothetical protein SpCBS45565_g01042 [Spizellomyces sp. 'palustris']
MSRFIWIGVSAKNAHDALEKRGAMNLLVAYMHATKHYLRNELGLHYDDIYPFISHLPEFAMDNPNQPDIRNLPLEISFQLGGYLMKAKEHGQIDMSQLGCMTNSLNSMIECFTGFERIRNTPLPFAYSIHLKQTLIVYLLSLPFQLVVDNKWGTIPVTLLAAFTLLGLEAIGGEIENPFGLDENDLPIDDICEMIHQEVLSIMDRPDKLDCSKWGTPWEDLSSTHAKLDEATRVLVKELTARVNSLEGDPQKLGAQREPPPFPFAEYDTRYAELQKENQLLNQLIKQYESTLEIVMSKFRSQAQSIQKEKRELQLKLERTLEEERAINTTLRTENTTLQEQLDSCIRVIREAVSMDEVDMDMVVSGMAKENETLRQMLQISGAM